MYTDKELVNNKELMELMTKPITVFDRVEVSRQLEELEELSSKIESVLKKYENSEFDK